MAGNAGVPVMAYAKLLGKDFVYYLTKSDITLGRTSDQTESLPDVQLGDSKKISRLHAKIIFNRQRGRFDLICLSKNGVYLDGRFINRYFLPAPLDSGSLVQIGETLFYFLLPFHSKGISLEGVEIVYPKVHDDQQRWTQSQLTTLSDAMLTYGFDSWKNLHKSVGSRWSLQAVKYITLKMVGSICHHMGVSDPCLRSKLSKILQESQAVGVASTPPLKILEDWKTLRDNAKSWGRRILLMYQIRTSVQTYGETAVLDGVEEIAGPLPAVWWSRRHDVDLLRGITRHGFGNCDAILKDKKLSFITTTHTPSLQNRLTSSVPSPVANPSFQNGQPISWPPNDKVGVRLREILRALKLRNAKYNRKSRRRRAHVFSNTISHSSTNSNSDSVSRKRLSLDSAPKVSLNKRPKLSIPPILS